MDFAGVKISQPLSSSLRTLFLTKPSPIQQVSIAPLCSGMSALLHASTGTGKTLAYLLPALKRLYKDGEVIRTPYQIMVLVPTKELALQVRTCSPVPLMLCS
jgi:superfamily II DNA/RNA helicase